MDNQPSPAVTGLDLLRAPFPAHLISKLPKPFKKDSPKANCNVCGGYHGLPAAHLDYVGHAALTHRLLEADPMWTWEPLAMTPDGLPKFDDIGGLWIKLTVCGVTRLGYGCAEIKPSFADLGSREKEIIGDALRNAAMRFGAALDLWSKVDLHPVDDDGGSPTAIGTPPPPPPADPASKLLDQGTFDTMLAEIKGAPDMKTLRTVYGAHFAAATTKGDTQAITDFATAKDARKAELDAAAKATK